MTFLRDIHYYTGKQEIDVSSQRFWWKSSLLNGSFIFQWKASSCITVPLLWLQGEDWSLLLCGFEPLPLWDYCWMKNLIKHKSQIVILTAILWLVVCLQRSALFRQTPTTSFDQWQRRCFFFLSQSREESNPDKSRHDLARDMWRFSFNLWFNSVITIFVYVS